VAVLASIFGAIGRFANRLLNSALGWASLLLFGRLPQHKQLVMLGITLGSLAWVVIVGGVAVPSIAAFLLAFVPLPSGIDPNWVRVAMLVLALLVPIAIGIAMIWLDRVEQRPRGLRVFSSVLRGYPFALAMALTVGFLAVIATVRKVIGLVKRWEEAHVPVVVKPGRYEELVSDLDDALSQEGLTAVRRPAPRALSVPGKLLGKVAGRGMADLVPNRMWRLVTDDLEVLVHPSDIGISGTKPLVARARAAIAVRLTWAPAYLTLSPDAQSTEDTIEEAARSRGLERGRKLEAIDARLASLVVPYEEWETPYRMRLQLERAIEEAREPAPPLSLEPGELREPDSRPGLVPWAMLAGVMGLLVLDLTLQLLDRRPSQRG
jgi:hypothetical protein